MKKAIAIVLCALLVVGMFTGCAKKAEPATKLEQIKAAGVLVVGTSPDYPPYEFVIAGENGQMEYKGIDISIAEEIAKDLGVELKIEAVDFDGLDSALQMGTIDMILAAYNPDDKRAEVMDFSDTYYIDEVVALVTAETADSYTDLATSFDGKKVGVQLGTTLETDYFPQATGAEKVALKKVTQLVSELKAGALDAIFVEKPIAEFYIARGDFPKGAQWLENYLKIGATNHINDAKSMFKLARIYEIELKDKSKAADAYEKFYTKFPNDLKTFFSQEREKILRGKERVE
mgnify:CR=1 FL=1